MNTTSSNQTLPKQGSITTRLTLIAAGLLAITVLLVSGLALFDQQRRLNLALEAKAVSLAVFIAEVSPESIWLRDFNTLTTYIQQVVITDEDAIYALIVDNDGQTIAQFIDQEDKFVASVMSDTSGSDVFARIDALKRTGNVLEITTSIIGAGQPLGVVKLGLSYNQTRSAVLTQTLIVGMATVASIGVSVLILAILLRRTLSPIISLTGAADRVSAGNLEVVIKGTHRADELGVLSRAFANMTVRLKELISVLEERAHYLGVVAAVGERLSAVLNLEELLTEVVNQIKENFGYYHVHIYLLDNEQGLLAVVEGTGAAGAEMKARGHSIPLDAPRSLVARAARSGQIVNVSNVHEAEGWLPNPLLPDTRAEIAVPIALEGVVVGVLDVQEDKIAGLDEDDINFLRSLTSQIAIAIRNARLFAEIETALANARAAHEQYIKQAWEEIKIDQRPRRQIYSQSVASPLAEPVIVEARQQAWTQPRPAIVTLNTQDSSENSEDVLVAPVKVGNVTVGALQMHGLISDNETKGEARQWTEQDLYLVETVLEQVAQIAENLRLFDDTREHASREQAIREITEKLRAAPNLDALLETAARELSQRLKVPHAVVELGIESELDETTPNSLPNP